MLTPTLKQQLDAAGVVVHAAFERSNCKRTTSVTMCFRKYDHHLRALHVRKKRASARQTFFMAPISPNAAVQL
jgi:hypothetical protein